MSVSAITYNNNINNPSPFGQKDVSRQYSEKTNEKANNLREMIKNLDRRNAVKTDAKGRTVYSSTSESKVNGYLDLGRTSQTKKKEEEKTLKHFHYNFKEISSLIQRAKTSVNAGQAVIKAKRKVMELKRELASNKGDSEEIQLAINHAKSMERAAKKKKRHLEAEELIEASQEKKSSEEKIEESKEAGGSGFDRTDMIALAEDKIDEAEEKIDDMEAEKLAEYMTEINTDESQEMTEDMIAAMDEMMEEYSNEARQMLDDTMEMLSELETADPNMSEEEFQKLKTKHRQSERKDIVKADMEYLKGMFQQYEKKMHDMPGTGAGAIGVAALSSAIIPSAAPAASAAEVAMASIDVSV
ncbi:MAG: DUF4175 domain-containing protein [Lachnospiraceae bacterium]|nr:DUF4175 domain-containing protein [Lachnospiraceae bacterium]